MIEPAVDGAHEAPRDMNETAFTHILRRLWKRSPVILAVVFVDSEGEAVDYCSSIDPYDAKILGAQMGFTTRQLNNAIKKLGFGELHEVVVGSSVRDLIVRRVTDEYSLAVSAVPVEGDHVVSMAIERCVDDLRREAHLDTPLWEPRPKPLEVYVREAVGWEYAPALFCEAEAEWREVETVLGRWQGEDFDDLTCFRVRTRDGDELTLAHDTKLDRWTMITDDW
ncbi:MAG: hypothetical protein JRH11_01805 [Deltaproteobacteria bacterium]|nr:hypothetical protein [Deltaproteobacteria bacterium]